MFLIWVIARREFTGNIFSLRLFIGLIVCFALFVSSTYVLTEDYEKRLSVHNAAEIENRNALEEIKAESETTTIKMPSESVLLFILPDSFR